MSIHYTGLAGSPFECPILRRFQPPDLGPQTSPPQIASGAVLLGKRRIQVQGPKSEECLSIFVSNRARVGYALAG